MVIISCQDKDKKEGSVIFYQEDSIQEVVKPEKGFQNIIVIDSFLVKKAITNYLTISNTSETDSLVAFCTCEKNVKNNTIAIQLQTAIPVKSEILKGNRKRNTILQKVSYGYIEQLEGQFKYLTFKLKDSLVQSIDMYAKSTEKDYDRDDYEEFSINKYKIKISTFNYSIASDVYGDFEIFLPQDFGFFENDTIVKGYFSCINWKIQNPSDIKSWNIHKKMPRAIE